MLFDEAQRTLEQFLSPLTLDEFLDRTLVGGFVIALLAVGYGLVAIALKLAGLPYVPGYASLLVTIAFLSGVQLMVMGMVGQYVARVYDETRGRPLYLVREARGFGTWTNFATPDAIADGFRVATGTGRPSAPRQ